MIKIGSIFNNKKKKMMSRMLVTRPTTNNISQYNSNMLVPVRPGLFMVEAQCTVWSSSCWMTCRKTQPWQLKETVWPPPRRPTNEKHLKDSRKQDHQKQRVLRISFNQVLAVEDPGVHRFYKYMCRCGMPIPWARLDVHKVSLTIQGCEADTGGRSKRVHSADDGIFLSLGWT